MPKAKSLDFYSQVAESSDRDKREIAIADLGIAKAAYLHFASVVNQSKFIMMRDTLLHDQTTQSEKEKLHAAVNKLLDEEVRIAAALFEISRQDSRSGFEASNQYYYVSQDLMEKVINCEFVRKNL